MYSIRPWISLQRIGTMLPKAATFANEISLSHVCRRRALMANEVTLAIDILSDIVLFTFEIHACEHFFLSFFFFCVIFDRGNYKSNTPLGDAKTVCIFKICFPQSSSALSEKL